MSARSLTGCAVRTGCCAKSARYWQKPRGLVRDGDRLGAVTAFPFVNANQAIYGVATMCRVLAVSASGYYAWRQRPPSARARADAGLTARIRAIHRCSRGTYGTPRIHEELLAADIHLGRKQVARLMKAAGLAGVSRRRWVTTTVRERGRRRIGSSAISLPRHQTVCGLPISLTFRLGQAFSTWPWYSTLELTRFRGRYWG